MVHLLVCELRRIQNARCNDEQRLRVFWFYYVKNFSSMALTHISTISPLYFQILAFDSVVK